MTTPPIPAEPQRANSVDAHDQARMWIIVVLPARRALVGLFSATEVRDDPVMDVGDVKRWFAAYLADFIALGRGDIDDVGRILAHYGVPFILSSDAGCLFLTDEEQVLSA